MLLEVDSGDTDRGKRETDPSRGPHQGPVLPSSPRRATVSKEDWQKEREVFRKIQKVQATFVHKTMGFNFFNATSGLLRGDRMGNQPPTLKQDPCSTDLFTMRTKLGGGLTNTVPSCHRFPV